MSSSCPTDAVNAIMRLSSTSASTPSPSSFNTSAPASTASASASAKQKTPRPPQIPVPVLSADGKTKTFPCSECSKVFNAAWKLKRHTRVHTGEKPFACDVPGCNKRYSEKGALVVHKKTKHVTLKPFVCPKPGCNRRFKIRRDVNNHLQNFHTLQKVEKREARLFERLQLLEDEYSLLQVYAQNLESLVHDNGLQASLPALLETARKKVRVAARAAGKDDGTGAVSDGDADEDSDGD